jgi:hypothetical protein
MRYLKTAGLSATTMALIVIAGASSASATTLEVAGVTQNRSVTIAASLAPGTSTIFKTTTGESVVTCMSSQVGGSTASPFTGASVTSALSILSFTVCTHPVTVHQRGTLHVEHVAGTTNGTVTWSGGEITVWSTLIGGYVTCRFGTRTHIGTLTGVASGHGTLHVNAVVACPFFYPSMQWQGTYSVTSPTGLGVSA